MKRTLYQVGSKKKKFVKFAINGTSPSLTCISTLRYVEAGIALLPGAAKSSSYWGCDKTPKAVFHGLM